MADILVILGFLLLVIGVGLYSVPAALIVAGVICFLAGGAAYVHRDDAS